MRDYSELPSTNFHGIAGGNKNQGISAQPSEGERDCPVPLGTYDVVAVAIDGSGNTYAATVIMGVQPGNSLGTVPLALAGRPASIVGQITTSSASAGTAADLVTSAL